METNNEKCCPEFNPTNWDNNKLIWDNKTFIKETMPVLFHIPFPKVINKKITNMVTLLDGINECEMDENTLMLFHDPSLFKGEIYLSVDKPIPNANNVTISGEFITKVYEGDYKDVPKFMKQMANYVSEKGKSIKKYYVHYAYCPKCAQKFGTNYMVFFAQV